MERDVAAPQVGHGRGRALGRDPPVVVPAGERRVLAVPAVVDVLEELQAEVVEVGPERQHLVLQVLPGGLAPDRLPVRQHGGVRVAVAAHATHGAEVVVEGAVLLHQHDDVLDVVEGAGPSERRDRRRARDRRGEHGQRRAPAGELQESATVDLGHLALLRVRQGPDPRRPALVSTIVSSYALLVSPSANRVYARSAAALTVAELGVLAETVLVRPPRRGAARGDRGRRVRDVRGRPRRAALAHVANVSTAFALFQRTSDAIAAGGAAPARLPRRRPADDLEVPGQDQRAVHQAAPQRHGPGVGQRATGCSPSGSGSSTRSAAGGRPSTRR